MRRPGGAISAPAAAVLTGLALGASFPPLDLAPLAWVALWPLLRALRGRNTATRLALGTLAGIVWSNAIVGWWLYPAAQAHLAAGPVSAATFTVAATWVYGGAYLASFAVIYPWLPRPRWLAAPAAWVLLEAVRARALAGAPWGLLGHTQHALLPLAQLAELTGVGGLSFLVLIPAAALVEAGRTRRAGLATALVGLVAASLFGAVRLRQIPAEHASGGPEVVVVGGLGDAPDPLAAEVAASMAAAPAALTIWPESALQSYVDEEPGAAAAVAGVARARGWLLFGAPRYVGRGADRQYFNAAFLYDPAGRRHATYDKQRLVPFAERSPVPGVVHLPRPFTSGAARPEPLVAGRLRLGPLVCWEAIFPELARDYAARGVDLLVNLTSDRDLGRGAVQQLAFSRFRAIETRRWLIRASGVGPTVTIDPAGRIRSESRLDVPLATAAGPTFYVRHGDLVTPGAAALLALLVLAGTANRGTWGGANGRSR
jgi:apolipoprotein N-acyltransferase